MHYAHLNQAFAAGTLVLPFCGSLSTADSEWLPLAKYRFDWPALARRENDSYLLETVDYLIRTDFIYATVKSSTAEQPVEGGQWDPNFLQGRRTHVRVYLVPADLEPNQATWLRTAKASMQAACRDSILTLLRHLDVSHEAWDCLAPSPDSQLEGNSFFTSCFPSPQKEVPQTLSRIFQNINSPLIDQNRLGAVETLTERLDELTHVPDSIPGLRSTLYPYQANSVAKLLQEELCYPDPDDPTYICVKSPIDASRYFFVNPSTLSARSSPEQYSRSRRGAAGILAEDPGSGKTIMILALVLATKFEVPVAVPSSPYYTPVIITPAIERKHTIGDPELLPAVPSLRQFSLHRARTSNVSLTDAANLLPDHLAAALTANNPYYMDFYPEIDVLNPSSFFNVRRSALHPEEKIFLSVATLVVVPAMLRLQWDAEITKHVEDGALRILVLKTQSDIVSVERLANDYDIILMSYEAFAWAVKHRAPCSCKPASGYCLPVLLHICWKRLVIDEGNICGSGVTELVNQLRQIKAENKWIVTGTPTTNLVGGTVDADANMISVAEEPSKLSDDAYKAVGRPWSTRDRDDLNRLAYMIGGFLAIPPFHLNEQGGSGISYFKKHIIEPLFHPNGPQFGTIEALSNVMQRVIIRHKAEDRAKDIILPPMTHETVLLELDEYAAITYNVMQTVIAVNAVDSERVGPDYLFSPQNVPHLRTLVANVSQSLFWHVDDKIFDIDQAMPRTKKALDKCKSRDLDLAADIALLELSLQIQEKASADSTWRGLMTSVELPYRLAGVPPLFGQDWGKSSLSSSQSPEEMSQPARIMLGSSRISKLRILVSKCPPDALTLATISAAGQAIRQAEVELAESLDAKKRHIQSSARKTNKAMAKTGITVPSTSNKAELVRGPTANGTKSLAELNALANSQASSAFAIATHATGIELDGVSVSLIRDGSSPIDPRNVTIGRSGSSKLDYILQEVRKYSANEKFLVFSSSVLTLAHVADGLSLMGVRFLQLSGGQTRNGKEQVLTTFKTSDDFRVLLMELKYGARGLNITEASRIIFCEPVWGLDVESQAIKRAYRIGQTRPITVKTLAIRETFEEEIMKRRTPNALSKDVCVDDGMRGFLMNPSMIGHRDAAEGTGDSPLIPLMTPSVLDSDMDAELSGIAGPDLQVLDIDRPRKRAIRFVESEADSDIMIDDANIPTSSPAKKPRIRFDI
ncbi:hypothetical protein DL93DRAFT_2224228 [Clavulina sp. PMI_390]|nr:hypothetical protein DL93DRAFT_2224228 [Clavulina sp. PMI_390]